MDKEEGRAIKLEEVVARVAELERQSRVGELVEAEFLARAQSLWHGWIACAEPEAAILKEVLAAVESPQYQQQVTEIWGRWLNRVQAEEGMGQHE